MFRKKGGKNKKAGWFFTWPTLFVFIIIVLCLVLLYMLAVLPSSNAWSPIAQRQAQIVNKQDTVLKNEVYTVITMLDGLNKKVEAGELTMAKAKKLGADLIRDMRYGADKGGYFFIDTVDGVNVVLLGDKATEGRDRLNDNINGVYYVKDLLAAGKKADGDFANYSYPKPGENKAKFKRSYALEFKPFGWVVGTGYYLEDAK